MRPSGKEEILGAMKISDSPGISRSLYCSIPERLLASAGFMINRSRETFGGLPMMVQWHSGTVQTKWNDTAFYNYLQISFSLTDMNA